MGLDRRTFLRGTAAASLIPFLPACTGPRPPEVPGGGAADPGPVDFLYGHSNGAVRLNKNENPFGPSPRALEAIRGGLDHAHRYVGTSQLRKALAELHGVGEENVRLGTGSGDVLRTLPIALLRDGGNVVATLESYRATPAMAEQLGAEVRWISLKPDWTYDVEGLLGAVDSGTKILYLVNPNNPTGTTLDYDEIVSIADSLPKEVLFLIDEAYFHFLPAGSRTGVDLFKSGRDNVFVTRTFSKAYGLAGLRIGYGIGSADVVARISDFMTTSLNTAGFGGAIAALSDGEHVRRFVDHAKTARAFYEKELSSMGLEYVVGSAPLILVEVGERCEEIVDAMAGENVFVRNGRSWDVPRHIRISYGLEDQNRAAIESLGRQVG
jgi:histidinol-phosphate aminotransferase